MLKQFACHQTADLDAISEDICHEVTRLHQTRRVSAAYEHTRDFIEALIASRLPDGNHAHTELRRRIVAKLLSKNAPGIIAEHQSMTLVPLIEENFARLSASLEQEPSCYEDGDLFLKDVAYACGEAVPCGAQVVSPTARLSVTSLLIPAAPRAFGQVEWLRALSRLGHGWFRIHTDPRMLQDFNEAGWDECYRRIAELMRDRTDIFGMVGTSWFYDPQLISISPRLAYLQQRPLERGAYLFRHGPAPQHTKRAIEKSGTRRRLYEEGKYLPEGYSLIWPRKALCKWAGV